MTVKNYFSSSDSASHHNLWEVVAKQSQTLLESNMQLLPTTEPAGDKLMSERHPEVFQHWRPLHKTYIGSLERKTGAAPERDLPYSHSTSLEAGHAILFLPWLRSLEKEGGITTIIQD